MPNPANKGIELFSLDCPQYLEGSPVMITAGALMMDRFSESVTVRLKLKNISDARLVSCEVRIELYDARGFVYEHDLFYKFDGLNVPRGKEFGSKVQISLPDNLVRSFDVRVTEVTFGDYTRWDNTKKFHEIDPIESLSVAFDSEEMARQYAVRYGSDCAYMPKETADIWYCTCGAVNHVSETRCYACRRNRAALEKVNTRSLKRDSEARVQSEKIAEEAEARELEKKTHRRSVFLKIALIILPVLIVGVLIFATVPSFIEKRESYAAAEQLLADGKFDEAGQAFLALGNYSDSAERAAKDVPYAKACYVLDCAKNADESALRLLGLTRENVGDQDLSMFLYGQAYELFAPLGNFGETPAKITVINEAIEEYNESLRLDAYNAARSLYEKKSYLTARAALLSMAGYKDSAALAERCLYERAVDMLNFCEAYNVRKISLDVSDSVDKKTLISVAPSALATLGSDVITRLRDIFYVDGVELFYEDTPGTSEGSVGGNYLPICEATAMQFEALGDYEDSADCIVRCAAAGDFTAEFYYLLKNGDFEEAKTWLNTYDDDVPERDSVATWIETYATFRRYWKLYGGDSTLIPYSIGIDDGTVLKEFSSKVCIEDGKAILLLEHPEGDYYVRLYADAGETDFEYITEDENYYYARINQADNFAFMRYLANGTLLSSCEYRG